MHKFGGGLLLITLVVFSSISHAQRAFELSFALFSDSGWTSQELAEQIEDARRVYAQCHLRIDVKNIFVIRGEHSSRDLIKFGPGSEHGIVTLANSVRELPRPLVMLVGGFDLINANDTAFARARFRGVTYAESLLDTVWLPHVIAEASYRAKTRYSPLAHEVAHVLTLDPEHNGDHDLMSTSMTRTNETPPALCTALRESRFVYPEAAARVAQAGGY